MEQTLEERIRQLPADLQQEVSDFINFLLERRRRQKHPPTFSWAGALKDMRSIYLGRPVARGCRVESANR
jgi:hypothetical protein